MNKSLLLFVGMLFIGLQMLYAQGNPMFSTDESAPDSLENTPVEINLSDDGLIHTAVSSKPIQNANLFSRLMRMNTKLQKELRAAIAEKTHTMESDNQLSSILWILLISFLYGIAHSLGPGHNKVVVFSYFLTEKPKVKEGMLLGNLTAFIHAISGLLLAFAAYFILSGLSSHFDAAQASRYSMLFSFALIFIIGLILLLQNFGVFHQIHHAAKGSNKKSILMMAFAVGIVPCPGTMILVTFLLTFGFVKLSIFAALFMALGMGFTISIIAVITVLLKNRVLLLLKNDEYKVQKLQKVLSILGAIFIMIFGLLFFLGAW